MTKKILRYLALFTIGFTLGYTIGLLPTLALIVSVGVLLIIGLEAE